MSKVSTIVRKSSTLKSIDELNLSDRAKAYLTKQSGFESIDQMVWYGRYMAYVRIRYPWRANSFRKWVFELIKALEEAGFIRHDIVPASFNIRRLYRLMFYTVTSFEFNNLSDDINEKMIITHGDYRKGNEYYEKYQNPTNEQVETVKRAMRDCLDEKEYEVLMYRLGFEDGFPRDIPHASRRFGIERERVRSIETKALNKLRRKEALFKIA